MVQEKKTVQEKIILPFYCEAFPNAFLASCMKRGAGRDVEKNTIF